eukprot:TRINITY_DN5668_c0_g1_i3.p1 TRINITY_DN5668_c0_g1~~TRINITY_DN5668_c0_g1_i3.p1  ORF type:complete len:160 (-),score=36.82 TRINITY_DN5668_c0_g1_i3:108-587(-)
MDTTLELTTQTEMLRDHITHFHTNWDPGLPERGLVCRWNNCHRFFTDKTKFLHHACVHTGMKSFVCQQEGCGQNFTSESQLRAHLRRHSKYYKCTVCAAEGIDKSYTSGFNLKEHMRNVHEQARLVCKTCDRSYKSHKAWSAHLRSCVRTLKTTGFQPY